MKLRFYLLKRYIPSIFLSYPAFIVHSAVRPHLWLSTAPNLAASYFRYTALCICQSTSNRYRFPIFYSRNANFNQTVINHYNQMHLEL